LGYAVWQLSLYFDRVVHDDAFISFRYARNLARGHGLVMNAGERVEGYTNFLWTLLAAVGIELGRDPARGSQVAGGLLALALLGGAFVFTERRLGGGWFSLVAPACLAFNLAFVMSSLSGLETLLFTALVFGAYVTFLEERQDAKRRPGAWAVWCAVGTLVRPEGLLVFGLLAGWAGLGIWRGEPANRLRRAAGVYALLLAPLLAWRLIYYHSLFPNTFYVKVGYTAAQLMRGWRFMYHSVGWTLTAPLLLVAGLLPAMAVLFARRRPVVRGPAESWTRLLAGRTRNEALAVALLLWLGYFAYLFLVGGDYEPTARFYAPVLALVYLLFQEGLRTFVLLFQESGVALRAVAVVGALAGGVACVHQSEQRFALVLHARGWPEGRLQHHEQLRAVGEWLRDNTPPNSVVAMSSIGALSWFADRPVLDMMGLTDAHIGRRKISDMGKGPAGHEKGDGAYVLSRKPDVLLFDHGQLFPKEVERDQVFAGARGVSELEIAHSPDLDRDYELRRAPTPAGVVHYFALRR
jgi:hypothetical protein